MNNCEIIGFLADESDTGYGWHWDFYDLFAINVVGETIWKFKDSEIKMIPGDIMFVPSGVRHGVTGLSQRFTASIVSPI